MAAHDHLSEGETRDRDELEVGDGQRDADDGDGLEECGGDVANGEPEASDDEPDDVHDSRSGACIRLRDHCATERPQYESGDAPASDGGWDRDDENECDAAGQKILEE